MKWACMGKDCRRKMKYIKQKKALEYSAFVLFIVSIYLSIRLSDLPVIDNKIIESIFVHTGNVDAALLNVITGYFSGYIVYIFTVIIPSWRRKEVAMMQASHRLLAVYNGFIYTMLLLAKSAATEQEWKDILRHDTDRASFDDTYFNIIRQFDITSQSESLFKHSDINGNTKYLLWYEYLEIKFEHWYGELDEVFNQYGIYMEDELFECVYKIKTNSLFELILGKGSDMEWMWKGKDGIDYCECVPLSKILDQGIKRPPIFGVNKNVDGSKGVKECIWLFFELFEHINKFVVKTDDKRNEKDHNLKKFKNYNIGHVGTARVGTM